MNRFIRDNSFLSTPLPQDFKKEFSSLMLDAHYSVGSILKSTILLNQLVLISPFGVHTHIFEVSLPTHYSKGIFQPSELQELKQY